MTTTYKISFETVSAIAHPEYYHGSHPIVAASQVPDEHWHKVEREGEGCHSQQNGLLTLMAQGELIRNVRLFKGEATQVEWREVTS